MKKLKEILLIDDDSVNNYISESLLLKTGLTDTVIVKKNGREGMDYVMEATQSPQPYCPPFIIFDYNMPVMDGLEFLTELRRLDLSKKYRVVLLLLAVQIPPALLQEFIKLGIQDYTLKPLDQETVLQTYQKYWNKEGVWIG